MTTRTLNAIGATTTSARGRRTDLAAIAAQAHPDDLLTAIGIIGRAAMHAWRLGDMTDEEAADFTEHVADPLITQFARSTPT